MKHFIIEGQCRDYDFSTFCEECWPACLEFAQEWLEELADGCDVDEKVKIEFEVKNGSPDFCYGCQKYFNEAGENEDPDEKRDE